MPKDVEFHLDSREVRRLLNAPAVKAMVMREAHKVARNTRTGGNVRLFSTDRAHAVVSVIAWQQARHGDLTKAAAKAGLRVHRR